MKSEEKKEEKVFIPQSSGRVYKKSEFNFSDINPEESRGKKNINKSKIEETYFPRGT